MSFLASGRILVSTWFGEEGLREQRGGLVAGLLRKEEAG